MDLLENQTLKQIYDTENNKSEIINNNHSNEKIKYHETLFYDNDIPSYHNLGHQDQFKLNITNNNIKIYTYTINNFKGVDNLILKSTFLESKTPSVELKENLDCQIEFKWSHNLFNNMIKNASLDLDSYNFPKLDNYIMDINHNFFKRTLKQHKKNGKNLLNKWSTKLPEIPLYCYQPWFYSQSKNHFFPLFGLNNELKHHYVFNLNIFDLLCVRTRDNNDEKWRYLKKEEFKFIKDNLILSSDKMSDPILYGNFRFLNEKEIDYLLKNQTISRYVHKFINIETSKCNTTMNLESCNLFVGNFTQKNEYLMIFWMLHNISSYEYNITSNYTDEIHELKNGDFPILKSSLEHLKNNIKKFNWDKNAVPLLDHYSNFSIEPLDIGYYVYNFTNEPNYSGCENGCDLQETNSSLKIYTDVLDYKYSLILKALCQEKITFKFTKEANKIKTEIF